jgi:prolyl oligopeptidase
MYIIHSKEVQLDGQNPTILNGYGGFNVSILPYFSIANLFLMKHFRIVVAYPTLRGGGYFNQIYFPFFWQFYPFREYGERWHEAGMRERKQNVFDDFHSAAEYLIQEGYTNSQKYILLTYCWNLDAF